jgi:hypothetical protein
LSDVLRRADLMLQRIEAVPDTVDIARKESRTFFKQPEPPPETPASETPPQVPFFQAEPLPPPPPETPNLASEEISEKRKGAPFGPYARLVKEIRATAILVSIGPPRSAKDHQEAPKPVSNARLDLSKLSTEQFRVYEDLTAKATTTDPEDPATDSDEQKQKPPTKTK